MGEGAAVRFELTGAKSQRRPLSAVESLALNPRNRKNSLTQNMLI